MEYGLIYIKICPRGKGEWIKHCHLFPSTPKSFQKNIIQICNDINLKYFDYIVIPMDVNVHPGCVTISEKVEEIAKDIYDNFLELSKRQDIPNSIRCVYSIGEISNINVESVHSLGNDDVVVNVGHFLDDCDVPGLFKI